MNIDGQFEVLPPITRKRVILTISEQEVDQLIQQLGLIARESLRTGRASVLHGLAINVVEAFATQGVCQHCGCTDDHACVGGCFWVDDEHRLCSACAERMTV